MMGLKTILAAAGLMLAGAGTAQAPAANSATPVASTAAPAGKAPAGQANAVASAQPAPADAAGSPAASPTPALDHSGDPRLALDGAPQMTATPRIGQPTDGVIGLQPQVTKNGERAHNFHNKILFPVITAICLLVLALLVWVVIRFRAAANPVPSRTSHNTAIEIVWTLGPVFALLLLAIPSIGLLQAQFKPAPANAVTLKAIGNQWYWSYQYPDHGGIEITSNLLKEREQVAAGERFRTDADGPRLLAVDNRIVLPVGVPIRLLTTANDVIHSWAIPAFWIKLDAVPGRINETSFTIEKPGLYFGQCSELCGARHAYMPIAVEAVPPAQFAAWIRAKGGSMPGAAAPTTTAKDPKAGSDAAENIAAAENDTAPVENATAIAPATNQSATNNRTGAGNAGL
ncbi:cytochrome c oxidase subunit II [Sphingomonas aracearum]|nr:cytochrome c oxidase subunit II [Sphingomonas aracearum]